MIETTRGVIFICLKIILSIFLISCGDEEKKLRYLSDPFNGLWSETYDYPLYDPQAGGRIDTVLTSKLRFISDSFDLKVYDESDKVLYFNNGRYSTAKDSIYFHLNIPSNEDYEKEMHFEFIDSRTLYLSTNESSGFLWGATFGPNYFAILPKNDGYFIK